MLTSLSLHNFALIEQHELSLSEGFNVITGETGAGKSLILDALSLCVGGRADTAMVRHGKESADIYAQFEEFCSAKTHTSSPVQTWFKTHERQFDGEILIRRQLSSNGRSKAWLNGTPVSMTELKELGALLVNIHSQHAQQALLKPHFVVTWLDSMANLTKLAKHTRHAYQVYHSLKRQADDITDKEVQRQDRIALLENQLVDIAPLLAIDYKEIEAEHEELSNLEALMMEASHALQALDNDADNDEHDAMSMLVRVIKICDNQASMSQTFAQAGEQLYLAQQQISDASALLTEYAEQQLPDPERLEALNELISLGHRLSRKHSLPAVDLIDEAKLWTEELEALRLQPTAKDLQAQIKKAWDAYIDLADELSDKRQAIAPKVSDMLIEQLKPLALPNGRCEFVFELKDEADYNAQGTHDIELLFSANVGMPMQPLYKIASGGELSRMALVMQVLLATSRISSHMTSNPTNRDAALSNNQAEDTLQSTAQSEPMLVFDEVDVGISGGTAQVVGELLRQLGQHRQLLAITHQAQVASQSHQHILVQKHHDEGQTTSEIKVISGDEQVNELARMSGGIHITEVTREHARSLLADVST